MLTTLKNYPLTVNLLLSASLVLTLARAITLPYLVIYLSGQFELGVADIGLVIGSSLIIGSVLSLYGGFLVDSQPGYRLILGCCTVFTLGFLGGIYHAGSVDILHLPGRDQPGVCRDRHRGQIRVRAAASRRCA